MQIAINYIWFTASTPDIHTSNESNEYIISFLKWIIYIYIYFNEKYIYICIHIELNS